MLGNQCVSRCPKNPSVIDGRQCVKSCPTSKMFKVDNDTCVYFCNEGYHTFNHTCVKTCPPNHKYLLNVTTTYVDKLVYIGRVIVDITLCVNECPLTTVVSEANSECELGCPKYKVLFNRSCVDQCPESHKNLLEWESEYNTIEMCVDECPSGLLLDDRSCAKRCPDDKFVDNKTCTYYCNNDTFICKFPGCEHQNVHLGNNFCLSECPPNHVIHEGRCFRYCYQTSNKFLLNESCVETCPFNLSLGKERQCVDKCPPGKVVFEGICRETCPKDTILVKDVCHKTCPSEVPYQNVYFTTVTSYWRRTRQLRHVECLELCPDGKLYSEKECVSVCPHKLSINKTCTSECPESHSIIYTTISKTGTTSICVEKRPNGSVLFNETYYNRCPDQANYEINGTCVSSCPRNETFYEFANDGAIQCVKACPTKRLILDMVCVVHCPKTYWLVNDSSCVQSCPSLYPLQQVDYPLYKGKTGKCVEKCPFHRFLLNGSCLYSCPHNYPWIVNGSECSDTCPDSFPLRYIDIYTSDFRLHIYGKLYRCVETCPFGTVVQNGSCVPSCFPNSVIYNGSCAKECPKNYRNILKSNRMRIAPYERYELAVAYVCVSECSVLNHQYPCVYFKENGTYLINGSCKVVDFVRIKDITQGNECAVTNVYNSNGILVLKCPSGDFQHGKNCVKECPEDHPLFNPNIRVPMCLEHCPSDLYTHKNNCLARCPPKTVIAESKCLEQCPDDMHFKMATPGGIQCLYVCPKSYYIEASMCIEKCPKKIFQRYCLSSCPSTHPFVDEDYVGISKVYTCYDYCPDSKLGNTRTFKCMYSFGCKGYEYDKKCYEKCPPSTFIWTQTSTSRKQCGKISPQWAALGICIFLILSGVAVFVYWCCTEKNTFSRRSLLSPETERKVKCITD